MKIGIVGNIANSGYLMAKVLSSAGLKAEFIDDLDYIYLYSVPAWSDRYMKVHYSEIESAKNTLLAEAPSNSLHYRAGYASSKTEYLEVLKAAPAYFPFFYLDSVKNRSIHELIRKLRTFDYLIVIGVNALLLATLSGQVKRTIFWPSGADFRMISINEECPSLWRLGSYIKYKIRQGLLQNSLRQVLAIASHDPVQDYSGQYGQKMRYFPFPLLEHRPLKTKPEIIAELGLSADQAGKKLIIMPSRLDFYWKKNNLFLAAFTEALAENILKEDMVLVCTAWGKDREKAQQLIGDKFKQNVVFSEYVYSLPLLYDIFYYADAVVDQFMLGSYGTSAAGAFSCGTPVFVYLNEKEFLDKGFPVPPVINCRTKEEIKAQLKKIAADPGLLTEYKKKTIAWFRQTHVAGQAVTYLKEILRDERI